MPPLSHLTSCTSTKSSLYLAISLAAAVSEPALYRLLKFHVPNLMSLFRCLGRTNVSVQVRGFVCEYFVKSYVSTGRSRYHLAQTPKLEEHPLSAVRDCLFNIFAATLHTGGRSSIRNLRTRHVVVKGTQLSHGLQKS